MNITREEAIEVLRDISDSGIIRDELDTKINDIIHCIECETDGLHVWGSEGDEIELYIGRRVDLITSEIEKKCQAIHDKYAYTPSEFEKESMAKDEIQV